MVDEVEIKVVADATQAEKSLKNIDYWLKALSEDTELLKDLQDEYKEALAESGGKRTEKVKTAYTKVLRLQSAIVHDKREIEKLDRKDAKNLKQSEKSVNNMSKAFKVIGRFVSAGAVIGGISKAIGVAGEGREDLYMAQRVGLSGGTYESIMSGFSSLGVNTKEIGGLLVDLREAAVGLKSGLNFNTKTIAGLAHFGIRADKSPEQILYDLAGVANASNGDASVKLAFRQFFGLSEEAFDKLSKGSDEIRRLVETAPEELGSLSTSALEEMKKTSEAWSRSTEILDNVWKSLTTGVVGEFLRNIAYWVERLALKYLGNPEAEKKRERAESDLYFSRENAKYVRELSDEDKARYIRNKRNMSEEELFLITGKKSNIEDYLDAKENAIFFKYYEDLAKDEEEKKLPREERARYLKKMEEILRRDSRKNRWIEEHGYNMINTPEETDEEPVAPSGYRRRRRMYMDTPTEPKTERFTVPDKMSSLMGGAGFGNQINVVIENFSQSLNGGNNLEDAGVVAYNGVYGALDDSAVKLVKSL